MRRKFPKECEQLPLTVHISFFIEIMLAKVQTRKAKPWFKKPNYMPNWLYRYFGETIKPLITAKDGRRIKQPPSFTEDKQFNQAVASSISMAKFSSILLIGGGVSSYVYSLRECGRFLLLSKVCLILDY